MMLKKRMMHLLVSLVVLTIFCAVAGNCIAGEAKEDTGDAEFLQSVDENGYIGDEEEPIGDNTGLNKVNTPWYPGTLWRCGDIAYYNPVYSYCANWETSLVCARGMRACGGSACYDPGFCTCDGSGSLNCRRYP